MKSKRKEETPRIENDRFNQKQASNQIKLSESRFSNERPINRSSFNPRDLPRNLPPIGSSYRRGDYSNYCEEDDYEDDDMKDFIDDDDDYNADEVSKAIKELFPRYNKNKYRYYSDDDIEESSYDQLMREEKISGKIGLQEDKEEERKKLEEKRRKARLRKKGYQISSDEDGDD